MRKIFCIKVIEKKGNFDQSHCQWAIFSQLIILPQQSSNIPPFVSNKNTISINLKKGFCKFHRTVLSRKHYYLEQINILLDALLA